MKFKTRYGGGEEGGGGVILILLYIYIYIYIYILLAPLHMNPVKCKIGNDANPQRLTNRHTRGVRKSVYIT